MPIESCSSPWSRAKVASRRNVALLTSGYSANGGIVISPREVDELLMDHPAVAQVVCFGMPHPKLGEEVAAVVVLREGQAATERELQAFVAGRAADYKVPKKILFMDEIPKGATGKLQRIGLAQKLGLG